MPRRSVARISRRDYMAGNATVVLCNESAAQGAAMAIDRYDPFQAPDAKQ